MAHVAVSQVKLGPMFSSNMVLQQQTSAPIWGEAQAEAEVSVTTSWNGACYTTTADSEGKWAVNIATPEAGGPYTIIIKECAYASAPAHRNPRTKKEVKARNSVSTTTLENVLIGEVWLCSGQSNMEMPVEGWGQVMNYKQERQDANQWGNIRLLRVEKAKSSDPQSELSVADGGWTTCNSETIAEFSATAYFFGRKIHQELNVPVGLIQSAWGGTIIEAWTSREAFENIPEQAYNIQSISNLPATDEERLELYHRQYSEWVDSINKIDRGFNGDVALWGTVAYDDSSWGDYEMPSLDSKRGTLNALWWARKVIDIPQSWEGKDIILNIGAPDDHDVTFFNGVQVGSTLGCIEIRHYRVPGALVKAGPAVVAVRIHDNGGLTGIGYADEQFDVSLADGTDKISLRGTWKFKPSVRSAQLPPVPPNTIDDPNVHTFLYNAMINPLVPYAIKGAIWYQGCNNASQGYQYRELMPMLINDWRSKWGYQFPFFITQLANYTQRLEDPDESEWAELREAQFLTRLHMSDVGLATTIDIGEALDIHPKNKQEVGRRLALSALNIAYDKDIVFEGPAYKDYQIVDNTIEISFLDNTADGLKPSSDDTLVGFSIAGADRVFHWAEAKIVGKKVVVSSPVVPLPLAVRYAWADNPACNLVNAEGLPATPFRTDDWSGITINNRR